MRTEDLDYQLPDELIARYPLPERDASRLLVIDRATGTIAHHAFRDLPRLLERGDLLVRNVSSVVPARLEARRSTGGRVELLLYRPCAPGTWRALARPAGRLADGEILTLTSGPSVTISRDRSDPAPGSVLVSGIALEAEMLRSGTIPLPPYLGRDAEPADRERYQTLWAREPGSVAAPTAGLHFSEATLHSLEAAGLRLADILLHVGPGTFLPVRTASLDHHRMHAEAYEVPEATVAAVEQARAAHRRIVAIGTTSVRALESAAGSTGQLAAARGETSIFLRPGSPFRVTTTLLTNFHQPRSTLLALVAAFAGLELLQAAYREAVRSRYRFLSYGDAMLVL